MAGGLSRDWLELEQMPLSYRIRWLCKAFALIPRRWHRHAPQHPYNGNNAHKFDLNIYETRYLGRFNTDFTIPPKSSVDFLSSTFVVFHLHRSGFKNQWDSHKLPDISIATGKRKQKHVFFVKNSWVGQIATSRSSRKVGEHASRTTFTQSKNWCFIVQAPKALTQRLS